MTTFLVQTLQKQIRHDFCLALVEAVNYQYWLDHGNWEIILGDKPDSAKGVGLISVGTLEFVFDYMEQTEHIPQKSIMPINIPPELFQAKFLKGKCRIAQKPGLELTTPSFVKSADQYKSFANIVISERTMLDGNYLVSEIIDIESEWRVFVHNRKLVGLNNCFGDFTLFPMWY